MEVIVTGSVSYTYADYKNCYELIAGRRIRLEPIITNRYRLQQIDAAFHAEIQGKPSRR
jgi:threonine dehydrogenase-like Zn-dependent dehydrogenase